MDHNELNSVQLLDAVICRMEEAGPEGFNAYWPAQEDKPLAPCCIVGHAQHVTGDYRYDHMASDPRIEEWAEVAKKLFDMNIIPSLAYRVRLGKDTYEGMMDKLRQIKAML